MCQGCIYLMASFLSHFYIIKATFKNAVDHSFNHKVLEERLSSSQLQRCISADFSGPAQEALLSFQHALEPVPPSPKFLFLIGWFSWARVSWGRRWRTGLHYWRQKGWRLENQHQNVPPGSTKSGNTEDELSWGPSTRREESLKSQESANDGKNEWWMENDLLKLECQLSYVNAYIWNLERWYWRSFTQGSQGDTDTKIGLFGHSRRRRGWDDLREQHWNRYIAICKIDS